MVGTEALPAISLIYPDKCNQTYSQLRVKSTFGKSKQAWDEARYRPFLGSRAGEKSQVKFVQNFTNSTTACSTAKISFPKQMYRDCNTRELLAGASLDEVCFEPIFLRFCRQYQSHSPRYNKSSRQTKKWAWHRNSRLVGLLLLSSLRLIYVPVARKSVGQLRRFAIQISVSTIFNTIHVLNGANTLSVADMWHRFSPPFWRCSQCSTNRYRSGLVSRRFIHFLFDFAILLTNMSTLNPGILTNLCSPNAPDVKYIPQWLE